MKARTWQLAAAVAVASCLPFARGLSLTKIFYIRDLSSFFWPRHLWIRDTLFAGHFPLWDPYASAGKPVFPDALNQLFLPAVLLLRLAAPAALGFNLIVALPLTVAAVGTFLFLRRHLSDSAAMMGAMTFALSGPAVSTANFPNLSWSIAGIGWALWAVDRDRAAPSRRSFAIAVGAFALQMLAGEPMTMAATAAVTMAFVFVMNDAPASALVRTKAALRVVAIVAAAGVVSAVQLAPMAVAARNSPRGLMLTDDFWALHPLLLAEVLFPHLYGDTFHALNRELPWIQPLNSGRDPFFYSLYLGPIALVLAAVGAAAPRRRWTAFWLVVALVSTLMAFGDATPFYGMLQRVAPFTRSFRFAIKFFLLAIFALSMLVADACEWIVSHRDEHSNRQLSRAMAVVGGVLAATLVVLLALVKVAPFAGAQLFFRIGSFVHVEDPVAGAAFLFAHLPAASLRGLLLTAIACGLVWMGAAAPAHRRPIALLLFAGLVVDLAVVQAGINPVLPAAQLGPPRWTEALRAHPSDRFYFGAKFRGRLAAGDIDVPSVRMPSDAHDLEEARTLVTATLAMTPAAWRVRELLSYDMPALWPIEWASAAYLFEHAERPDRMRFLARGGVRYCVLPQPPGPGAAPLTSLGPAFDATNVYDCVPEARRTYIASAVRVMPDANAQLVKLFDGSFDANTTVMLQSAPAATFGTGGVPRPAGARLITDADDTIAIEADVDAGGGYLVLLDAYDEGWRVDVDSQPATMLRANAVYRAVRLAPGRHLVTFRYRPQLFYASLGVSVIAALAVALSAVRRDTKKI